MSKLKNILQSILKNKIKMECDKVGRNLDIRSDDIYLVAYPKSGVTWLTFLVAYLTSNGMANLDFDNVEDKVADIYSNSQEKLSALPGPRILKSHEYFDPRYKKVIYLVRDPRDVAISYYHYLIKVNQFDENCIADEFISNHFLTGATDTYSSWGEHVGGWIGAREDSPDFLLLQYEDMLTDIQSELNRVVSFLGIEATTALLGRAIEYCSPENMRRIEKRQTDIGESFQNTRKDKYFVRKAVSGSGIKELSAASILKIENAWGPVMTKLGYLSL